MKGSISRLSKGSSLRCWMRLSYCRPHVPDLVLISPKRFNFDGDFEDDYHDVSPKKMDMWRFLVVGKSWIFVSLLYCNMRYYAPINTTCMGQACINGFSLLSC